MANDIENSSGRRGNRWSLVIWGAAACLLLLPLVAMQFTDEVDWTLADFIVIGAMLFAACGSYELATRLSSSTSYRAGCGAAIAGAFLLIWVNLAVGMIGSEDNPANLLFLGVLVVGLIGAILARLRPRGMVVAMIAMVVFQMLVAVVAIAASWGMPYSGAIEILGVTIFFAIPWLVSAALFWNAAREQVVVGSAG